MKRPYPAVTFQEVRLGAYYYLPCQADQRNVRTGASNRGWFVAFDAGGQGHLEIRAVILTDSHKRVGTLKAWTLVGLTAIISVAGSSPHTRVEAQTADKPTPRARMTAKEESDHIESLVHDISVYSRKDGPGIIISTTPEQERILPAQEFKKKVTEYLEKLGITPRILLRAGEVKNSACIILVDGKIVFTGNLSDVTKKIMDKVYSAQRDVDTTRKIKPRGGV